MKKPKRTRRTCKCGKIGYPLAREVANLEKPWVCPPCDDKQIFQDNAKRP